MTIEMVDMRLRVDENWNRRRTLMAASCLEAVSEEGAMLSSAKERSA